MSIRLQSRRAKSNPSLAPRIHPVAAYAPAGAAELNLARRYVEAAEAADECLRLAHEAAGEKSPEPASVLLDRIRAQREATAAPKRRRGKTSSLRP